MKEILEKASSSLISGLEGFFYRHGVWVARHPGVTILASTAVCCLAGLGLLNFQQETNMVRLWLPQDSDFVQHTTWLWEAGPTDAGYRYNSLILRSEGNILTPETLQAMYQLHQNVESILTPGGASWASTCMDVPVVLTAEVEDAFSGDDFFSMEDEEDDEWQEEEEEEDPSVQWYGEAYCQVVESMPRACLERSILELWGKGGHYSEAMAADILALSQQDVLDAINTAETSGIFLTATNFSSSSFLSGVERNSSGHIVSARATRMQWIGLANSRANSSSSSMGMAMPVEDRILDFEAALLDQLEDDTIWPEGVLTAASVMRQYGDVSSGAIWGDATFLTAGYFMIYVFVQAVLGKWNRVEQRAALAAVGISSTGLALVGSFGLCSALGLQYGPMHSLIFCLLVGLSIDDMFVLVQTWERQPALAGASLEDRVGGAMREAGVGITVTSVTDIMVFLIGGSTVLPSLRSYSIFTGVGIIFTYLLQLTFFLAFFTLDQKRIEAKRDGMFCCKKHPDHIASSSPGLLKRFFLSLGVLLHHWPAKVSVLLLSLSLCAASAWGVSNISVKLDFKGFLPSDSSLYRWFLWDSELFPQEGEVARIYLGNVSLAQELEGLDRLLHQFHDNTEYIKSVEGWYPGFKQYVNSHFRADTPIPSHPMEEEEFSRYLTQYLFSPSGSRFQPNFQFSSPLQCGQPAPPVLLSSIQFIHPKLEDGPGAAHLPAMQWAKARVSNLSGQEGAVAFPMAQAYSRWEVDEVLVSELARNLLLALAMVSLTSLVLLADLRATVLVLASVILTLVDVVGMMYYWGISIDIVCGTNLIISVGLCVDYSAHMAHTFLTVAGSGDERMAATLATMGPAVLQGGLSTLLAILMLVNSKSYVFITFFRVFFLVIVVGLFHGLVLLPVLLSLLSPAPYRHYTLALQEVQTEDQLSKEVQPEERSQTDKAATTVVQPVENNNLPLQISSV